MRVDRVKLVAEMARQDMTVLRLADLSSTSRATISAVRKGKTCSKETAAKIAAGLNVPVEQIMEEG